MLKYEKTYSHFRTYIFEMFSYTSFAGWTKVSETEIGTGFVDYERIRKVVVVAEQFTIFLYILLVVNTSLYSLQMGV